MALKVWAVLSTFVITVCIVSFSAFSVLMATVEGSENREIVTAGWIVVAGGTAYLLVRSLHRDGVHPFVAGGAVILASSVGVLALAYALALFVVDEGGPEGWWSWLLALPRTMVFLDRGRMGAVLYAGIAAAAVATASAWVRHTTPTRAPERNPWDGQTDRPDRPHDL